MSLNQKLLKEKLDAWAKNEEKLSKLTAKRNRELDPFIEEHSERVKPILDKYSDSFLSLNAASADFRKEIEAMLKANTDADGNPKILTVTAENATAQISRCDGSRVVDVQQFFALVKNKSSSFWNSLTVIIKHAEKLVGKEKLDEISKKKTTYSVAIALKK